MGRTRSTHGAGSELVDGSVVRDAQGHSNEPMELGGSGRSQVAHSEPVDAINVRSTTALSDAVLPPDGVSDGDLTMGMARIPPAWHKVGSGRGRSLAAGARRRCRSSRS